MIGKPKHKDVTRHGTPGFAAVPCMTWEAVRDSLPKPWTPDAVFLELRVAQSAAVAPAPKPFPSLSQLSSMTGWTLGELRGFLASEVWSDPGLSGDRLERWLEVRAARTRSHSANTTAAQRSHSARTTKTAEAGFSVRDEHSANTEVAHGSHGGRYTRVGSQITDHRSQITETIQAAGQDPDTVTEPSPITGNPVLTLALPQKAEPRSRPVTTEPTAAPHPPSRRAPPPRRGTGATPDEAAAVLAMLGAWSEISDDTAADARRAADATSGTWAQLLRAVRDPRIGADRLVRRFRTVARSQGRSSLWVRSVAAAGKDRMKPATIAGWHGGTNSAGRPVLEAGLDDEAQAWADTPEGSAALAEPTPDGWQHKRARAPDGPGAQAWAVMTALQRWRDGGSSGPNLAGDYGKPGRWDLAGDAVEHDRRRAAMGAAGGWAAWTGDATEAGRARYRATWVKAYEGVAP